MLWRLILVPQPVIWITSSSLSATGNNNGRCKVLNSEWFIWFHDLLRTTQRVWTRTQNMRRSTGSNLWWIWSRVSFCESDPNAQKFSCQYRENSFSSHCYTCARIPHMCIKYCDLPSAWRMVYYKFPNPSCSA